MLVLTRKIDEVVIIGGNIKVKVLGIDRGKVSLGFSAPPEIEINREEVLKRIITQATSPPSD